MGEVKKIARLNLCSVVPFKIILSVQAKWAPKYIIITITLYFWPKNSRDLLYLNIASVSWQNCSIHERHPLWRHPLWRHLHLRRRSTYISCSLGRHPCSLAWCHPRSIFWRHTNSNLKSSQANIKSDMCSKISDVSHSLVWCHPKYTVTTSTDWPDVIHRAI